MSLLSARARAAVLAAQTDECFLLLLEITHTSLSVPLRYVNSETDLTSNSILYSARGFEVPLASETRSGAPSQALLIDNTDGAVGLALLQMAPTIKPKASLKVVLASTPNTVERTIFDLIVKDAILKSDAVAMTLSNDDVLGGVVPCDIVSPASHPGAFGVP